MTTLNKSTLIGYLGHDAEVRLLPSGESVTSLSLATTETWKDKATGEKRESTEWHRIVLYRKLGEIAGQYLRKGMQVYIEGRLHTRKWTDKDGIERYVTEIIADDMKMLGSRPAERESDQSSEESVTTAASPGSRGSARAAAPDDRARQPARYAHEDADDMIPF